MKYLKSKKGSLENSILSVWSEAAKKEGNAFGMALQTAKENGEKTFTVAGKTYDVKTEMELDPLLSMQIQYSNNLLLHQY